MLCRNCRQPFLGPAGICLRCGYEITEPFDKASTVPERDQRKTERQRPRGGGTRDHNSSSEAPRSGRGHDIFISYARKDQKRILPIVRGLEAFGWTIFWDITIPTGKNWRQVIAAELDRSRCVVVVWSKTSIQSHWVGEEAEEARKRGILFPILIDDVRPPIGFRTIQSTALHTWNGSPDTFAFQQLIHDLNDALGVP